MSPPPVGSEVLHTETSVATFYGYTPDGKVKIKKKKGPGAPKHVSPDSVKLASPLSADCGEPPPPKTRRGWWTFTSFVAVTIAVGMFHGVGSKLFEWLWTRLF